MRTQEEKDKAQLFWQRVDNLKNEKFPSSTWGKLCEKVGINSNTLRSAKCYGSLPNDSYIDSLAKLFGVTRESLVCDESNMISTLYTEEVPDIQKRRQNVAVHIFALNEQMFFAIERLMGLSPNNSYKQEETKIYDDNSKN